MAYNLIHEPWLPFIRAGGRIEWSPPWGLTDRGEDGRDPVVGLAAPRPDFNGALVQFLIGLLQTVAAPEDERAWREWFNRPPRPEELRRRFEAVAFAFDLDGPGPRFLQEKLPERAKVWSINQLLIDQPGEITEEKNWDHFTKRGLVVAACKPCLATALLTLQINAPQGGSGHLTSLRGGGPLTTLVRGLDLWQTAWLGVLPKDKAGLTKENNWSDIFLWLRPPRPQEGKTPVMAGNTDLRHAYWSQPRRIWLDFTKTSEIQCCSLCGHPSPTLFTSYQAMKHGFEYKEGSWVHWLTPYFYPGGKAESVRASSEQVSYRHWLGYTLGHHSNRGETKPAKVVTELVNNRIDSPTVARILGQTGVRLWAFGYEMGKNSARAWVDGEMPLILVPPEIRAAFEDETRRLIEAAENASFSLAYTLKDAWFGPKSEKTASAGQLGQIRQQLWMDTEKDFYQALHDLADFLRASPDELQAPLEFKEKWLNRLRRAALRLFDLYSQVDQIGLVNPKRVALARRRLSVSTGLRAKKPREIMDLPSLSQGGEK